MFLKRENGRKGNICIGYDSVTCMCDRVGSIVQLLRYVSILHVVFLGSRCDCVINMPAALSPFPSFITSFTVIRPVVC